MNATTINVFNTSDWAGSGQLRAGIALARSGYRTRRYLGFRCGDHVFELRDGRIARVDLVTNRATVLP